VRTSVSVKVAGRRAGPATFRCTTPAGDRISVFDAPGALIAQAEGRTQADA
jgi:hypothetical protein